MKTKSIDGYPYKSYEGIGLTVEEGIKKSEELLELAKKRRSVREISDKPVPFEIIENIIQTAGLAPSGANKQPWTFCIVKSQEIKKKIRVAAEEEEYTSYNGRMNEEWLEDLKPLGTDWNKPFLEKAPYLIIVFKKTYDLVEGQRKQNYYVNESVGLACGFLLMAIHNAGLVSLTHTPSPMNFLSELLGRPANEKPFLLIPVGYPENEVFVPDINKKAFSEITNIY